MADISPLEYEFESLWLAMFPNIDLEAQYRINKKRRFKYDYCNTESFVLIEINGQIWHIGGHSSGTGLMRDYEKLNFAARHGYVTFQLSREMITEYWMNEIADTIKERASN